MGLDGWLRLVHLGGFEPVLMVAGGPHGCWSGGWLDSGAQLARCAAAPCMGVATPGCWGLMTSSCWCNSMAPVADTCCALTSVDPRGAHCNPANPPLILADIVGMYAVGLPFGGFLLEGFLPPGAARLGRPS